MSIRTPSIILAAALLGAMSAHAFELSSPSLSADGAYPTSGVYQGFGCTGGNLSPALAWRNAPEGTRSYALTMYDPDAPTGSGWWHWVVVNLPASTQQLAQGVASTSATTLPGGASQIRNDYGAASYGGPCPPVGDKPHRYIFTVHALKTDRLDLPPDASPAMAGYFIRASTIGSTELTVRYGRER